MAAVITSLYRAYCYARLLEMRRRRHAGPGKGLSGSRGGFPDVELANAGLANVSKKNR
jgi:hypothetical protein